MLQFEHGGSPYYNNLWKVTIAYEDSCVDNV
jgi:hypothetical protein